MRRELLFLCAFVLLLTGCRHETSCEGCQTVLANIKDSLPADYPFANGSCNSSVLTGISIPPHDTVGVSDYTDKLPDSLILDMPPAGDQGQQSSCPAWATVYGAAGYYFHVLNKSPYSDSTLLSPAYTYNQITKGKCNCTSIYDHLYLLETQGAAALQAMPYNAADCLTQPDSVQKRKAARFRINTWKFVDIRNQSLIKELLLHQMPVIFSVWPDADFQRPASPYLLSKPASAGPEPHAIVICGYSNTKNAYRILNSWGNRWADQGFVWMSYDRIVQNPPDWFGAVIMY